MKSVTIYIALLGTALIAALTGCDHKDILYPDSGMHQLRVMFMWEHAPEASPEGMTIYFFPQDKQGKIWRYDIAGTNGGAVELPTGTYSLLAYNNDLPGITVSDLTSLSESTATARTTNGISSGTGKLYTAVIGHVEVTPCGVIYRTRT